MRTSGVLEVHFRSKNLDHSATLIIKNFSKFKFPFSNRKNPTKSVFFYLTVTRVLLLKMVHTY